MFGGIIDKLKIAQKEAKDSLNKIFVDAQADNGRINVVLNANKKVQQITISQELFNEGDKEAIEELLQVALNEAIEKADVIFEEKMKNVAKDAMPNIPGLNF